MFTQIANFPSDKEFQIPQFAKAALKYLKLKSESYKDGAGKAIKSVEFGVSQVIFLNIFSSINQFVIKSTKT